MKSAYASSGKIFEQVSRLTAPGLYERLKAIQPGEIVTVNGAHDHVEKLLDTLKVPYTQLDIDRLTEHNGGRVVIANCSRHGQVPVKYIQQFIEEGGRLVSTDWAIDLTMKAFPKRFKKVASTKNDVVEIQCDTDLARKLVGLNYAQCHPKWWLEGSSDAFDIIGDTVPVITSDEMQTKYGTPHIAAGFRSGEGEVFHFVSHLELQRTRLDTKADKGTLDDFLKKMNVAKTADMEDATVAELESAYSTLNTLAHLVTPGPLLGGSMKSVLVGSGKSVKGGATSVKLI